MLLAVLILDGKLDGTVVFRSGAVHIKVASGGSGEENVNWFNFHPVHCNVTCGSQPR